MKNHKSAIFIVDLIAISLSFMSYFLIVLGTIALAIGLNGCEYPKFMTRVETHHNVLIPSGDSSIDRHEAFAGVGPDWRLYDNTWLGVFAGPSIHWDENNEDVGIMVNPRFVTAISGTLIFIDCEAAVTDDYTNVFTLAQMERRW
jgi:hypothetical protein